MSQAQTQSACSQRPRGRRKQLFINPGFQWRYAALIASGVFVIAVMMCSVMYGVLYQQARARMLHYAPASQWENTISLVLFAGVFAITMSAAFALWGVIVSHRICGPLFVMERYFNELAAGKLPVMRNLRKHDEFQSFYATLRRAVSQLRDQKHAQLAMASEALALVRSVENGEEAVRAQALEALRQRIATLHDQLADSLGEENAQFDPEPAKASSRKQAPELVGAR